MIFVCKFSGFMSGVAQVMVLQILALCTVLCSHIQDDVSTWMWFSHLEDQGSTFFQNTWNKLIILHNVRTHKTITCFGLVAYKDASVLNVCGQVVSIVVLYFGHYTITAVRSLVPSPASLKTGTSSGWGVFFWKASLPSLDML